MTHHQCLKEDVMKKVVSDLNDDITSIKKAQKEELFLELKKTGVKSTLLPRAFIKRKPSSQCLAMFGTHIMAPNLAPRHPYS